MKNCIVCQTPLKSQISVSTYCSTCRSHVAAIRRDVTAAMRAAQLPDVRQLACVDCGRAATGYEHRYYSLPLEVDPVCTLCNQARGVALDVVDLVKQRRGLSDPQPVLPVATVTQNDLTLDEILEKAERDFIEDALRKHHGNGAAAARHLGISYRSIRHRMQRLGVAQFGDRRM